MKILIGYDGSESANEAIDDLARAGLPDHLEAMVVTVAEQDVAQPAEAVWQRAGSDIPVDVAEDRYTALIGRSSTVLDRGVEKLREIHPQWEIMGGSRGGLPVPAILKTADEWKPDLLVIGSHGRSCLGRVLFGSVSLQILSHATCPVRIGRRRPFRPDTPPRILVATDGSPDATRAIDLIARRAWERGTAARVVAVFDLRQFVPPHNLAPTLLDDLFAFESVERVRLRRSLDEACSRLQETGLDVQGEILDGDPRTVLLGSAEEWGADSIMLGARGVSGLERFVLGSVSYAVAARARCSVEVARAGGRQEDSGM